MVIGMVGGLLANLTDPLMVWIGIDDAVGATSVHGFGGAWGMIAVGIFRYRVANLHTAQDCLFFL